MSAEPYDAIIVGGGPAGLKCSSGPGPMPPAGAGMRRRRAAQRRVARTAWLPFPRRRHTSGAASPRPRRDATLWCRASSGAGSPGEPPEGPVCGLSRGRSGYDLPQAAAGHGREGHCPYCDGWEMRDQPLRHTDAAGTPSALRGLCSPGPRTSCYAPMARAVRRMSWNGSYLRR